MIRTESGRMITKNINDMTIAEYMEYEAEMKRGNNPNNYHLFTPQSHYETKEVSSDEDVDEWLNEELSKRMTGQDKEEEDDTLIDILKTVGVSFVAEDEKGDSSETLLYQQPSNEINPGSFTLSCTIGNLKIYAMADVGAGINKMPKLLFEHLKLANLKKTSMVGDMTKKAPLGIVENIPVKIDKFLFYSDFVVIDTLERLTGEISLEVGNEKVKFDMNGEICHSRVPLEKIYMASSIQKSEYFNPREIENDDSPALEQRTFHYCEESIGIVDSSSDSKENEVGSHLSENILRWHVYKPVHITFEVCEEDCGIWPTCNLDLSFCSGYDDIYGKEENGMLKQ
ncbi:copia protein [Tanacetum coccineum]